MRKRINALVRDKKIIVHHPFMLSKCILYSLFEFSNFLKFDIIRWAKIDMIDSIID